MEENIQENKENNEQSTNPQPLTKKERRMLRRQEKAARREGAMHKHNIKRIIGWLVVMLVLAAAVWGIAQLRGEKSGVENTALLDPVSSDDWIRGNPAADAVLVEYSDLQCPACGAYFPIVRQLLEEFGDQVAFVYRHFPLRRIHKNADLAARTAEAAGIQGKFWEMHDLLFENQDTWSGERNVRDFFTQYAKSLGLDMARFERDIDSAKTKNRVESNFQSGIRSGVNATPTFFLNGEKIVNPRSFEEFKALITNVSEKNSISDYP